MRMVLYKVIKYCVGELFVAEDVLEAIVEVGEPDAVVVGELVVEAVVVTGAEVVEVAIVAVAATHW